MNKIIALFFCNLLACNSEMPPRETEVISIETIEGEVKNVDVDVKYDYWYFPSYLDKPKNAENIMWDFYQGRMVYIWEIDEFDDSDAGRFLVPHLEVVDVYKWLRKNRSYTAIKCVRLANAWWAKEEESK